MIPYIKTTTALLFIFLAAGVCNLWAVEIPRYALHVKVLPESRLLEGRAHITVPAGMNLAIQPGDCEILSWVMSGSHNTGGQNIPAVIEAEAEDKTIIINYTAEFPASQQKEDTIGHGSSGRNILDDSGITLLSDWYPAVAGLAAYSLIVDVPSDFEAVSEANTATAQITGDRKAVSFTFAHPLPGLTLIAGRYTVYQEDFRGISLKAFLFSADKKLASTYFQHTKRYLELYESMLGRFPYASFAIVENRFQTGYSFPTYTLLGTKVLKLPFIVETSLGHEILHQWFGNHIYVDYEKGNWSEGLVTYLADHWYKHLAGEGPEYRKKILIGYMNYVSPHSELTLERFSGVQNRSSRAVGYGKGAMLFHMLRMKLGDTVFFRGLKQFITLSQYKQASWDDVKHAFASETENDLEDFFGQWVYRKGIPSVDVENIAVLYRNGTYLLEVDIVQKKEIYDLDVPVCVETSLGREESHVHIDTRRVHMQKMFTERPERIVLDARYDIMRDLTAAEKPPVISAFTGSPHGLVIMPADDRELYDPAVTFFEDRGYAVKTENEVTNRDIVKRPVLFMSAHNGVYRRLFADKPLPDAGLIVQARTNPLAEDKVALLMQARSSDEFAKAFRKIYRYGTYSYLLFEDGKNITKQLAESVPGIVKDFTLRAQAVVPQNNLTLEEIVDSIQDRRVVFVGEVHSEYAHHVMQLEIIRRLYKLKGRLVIGMEMFQQPFQEYLDRYIQGEISEEDFLQKTEYFTRWKFDYNLYREIMHFARAHKIPVIALNLGAEIIKKVSAHGLEMLTEEEQQHIPAAIDMTNQDYRQSMQKVFSYHTVSNSKDFENFFQSQILWDETMAHNAAEALQTYPDTPLVVLAGNGHLRYSWGIPGRLQRLTGETPVVILNSNGGEIDRGIADFVLFPEPLAAPQSPRLMVMIKEEQHGVVIEKIMPGGPAEQAGLREEDIIVAVDKRDITDIAGLKIFLLNHKKGDVLQVTVKRKRLMRGYKEIVVPVTL